MLKMYSNLSIATVMAALMIFCVTDISRGAEGELIKNGSFETHQAKPANASAIPGSVEATCKNQAEFPGWKLVPIEASAVMTACTAHPLDKKNPTAVLVVVEGLSSSAYSCVLLENGGKDGFTVQKAKKYSLSFYARSDGKIDSVKVLIPKQEGATLAEGTVSGIGKEWKKFTLTLTVSEDYDKSRLIFSINKPGKIRFDAVSLTAQ